MEHPLAQFLYCPECGSSHFEVNNEKSKKCAECGFVYYFNPSDGHKSIYDPCPKGYRVVSPRVLDEIEQKGEFVKQSATAVFKYCYDGTNYAYWPLAGCKWGSNGGNNGNNTGLDASKGAACYWSNSSASSYGNDKDQGATSLYYKVSDKTWTHSSGRSHAFSVRCMKDTENR